MSEVNLAEMRRRAEEAKALACAAAKGPWTIHRGAACLLIDSPDENGALAAVVQREWRKDGEFVAASCEIVPALADDVQALTAEVERLKGEILDILAEEVGQACYIEAREGNGHYIDMGLSTYRCAIQTLVDAGRMRRIDETHEWYEFVERGGGDA